MSKNKRRVQTPKSRNIEWMRAEQERRRSSAASPMRNKKKYSRKSKYQEW